MSSSSKDLSLEMSKYLMNWHQNRNGKCVFPPEGGVSSSSNKERNKDGGEGGASGISPLFHLPAEFFHPAGAVIPAPPRSRSLRLTRGLRLTSPASWASLRSPGTHSKMLCTQVGGGEGHSAFTKEVRWEMWTWQKWWQRREDAFVFAHLEKKFGILWNMIIYDRKRFYKQH